MKKLKKMAGWMNVEDNRRFVTRIGFVCVILFLLGYLHMINQDGDYKELIVGIIGIFVGVASTAAKDLIAGGGQSEIEELKKAVAKLESREAEHEKKQALLRKEVEIYKSMIEDINEKLVIQSGMLNAQIVAKQGK